MTNKPMFSVERELLERVVDSLEGAGLSGYPAPCEIQELRALLDSQPNQFECLDGGKCGIGGYCDACPHTKTAAQHQGYPVNRLSYSQGDRRYVNGWNDACSHWEDQPAQPKDEVERLRILVDSKEVERQQCIEECSAEIGALRTQLAEQPSLVAVVMPDDWEDQLFAEMSRRFDLRKMIDDDHMVYDDTQIGVEFARDWIKARLNRVKS